MKKTKIKILLVLILIIIQLYSYRFLSHHKLYFDLFFIFIFYFAYKKSYLQAVAAGFLFGILSDFFSLSYFGVFAFSRSLIAALINVIVNRFDLSNRAIFFLFFSFFLFLSNLIASLFFKFLFGFDINYQMLAFQPLLTAFIGMLLISLRRVRNEFNLY